MKILQWLKERYRLWNRSPVEIYLSDAEDIHVLEHRLWQIERGQAPFQRGLFLNRPWHY